MNNAAPEPAPSQPTYERLAALPLTVEGYELSGLELTVSDRFVRLTTVVQLFGAGNEGAGEDTTYAPPDQLAFRAAGPVLPLAGDWTLDGFSRHLARLDLFPSGPHSPDFVRFRRWAFESAALDLALRQAGLSLSDALQRDARPLTFVVSPGPDQTARLLARYPDVRLKAMALRDWDDAAIDVLAASGAVDIVDLKGQYPPSVPVAVPATAALYRRVLRAFPNAVIEDPGITPGTAPLLRAERHRISWDAPIRHRDDIAAWGAHTINVKPSRFGSVRALLDAYDYCERAGIRTYGGGQFELGPGRPQIQLLASIFHPDAPNDVAPAAFNTPIVSDGLPVSPLPAPQPCPGFGTHLAVAHTL
jgi:hypothetical protein